MLPEIWPTLRAKGQLVNLVTAGNQTKFENLNVFQQEKWGGWNISDLKVSWLIHINVETWRQRRHQIDPGVTQCWRTAGASVGLLGDASQQAESARRINWERRSLIKFKVKFNCEQTIKMNKMLRKPVTFMERAVISLCASRSSSMEVGQGIVPPPIAGSEWLFVVLASF